MRIFGNSPGMIAIPIAAIVSTTAMPLNRGRASLKLRNKIHAELSCKGFHRYGTPAGLTHTTHSLPEIPGLKDEPRCP